MEPNYEKITRALREAIERQVETSREGRALLQHNEAAIRGLVTCIVGNLAYTVAELIEES